MQLLSLPTSLMLIATMAADATIVSSMIATTV
jgi:hypothetical protein